jgi:beta-lactamase superfamily II metal-dependent hydrolase
VSKGFGYEIDFLPVGNGEKSGDAIALRYGTSGEYTVMVIDGGTKESGQALVDHIKEFYETDFVDYVVCTHPDGDHLSGLTVVLEQLNVGSLWIHQPWLHSSEMKDLFKDGRITDNSLSTRLKDALNNAYSLVKLAEEKEIDTFEPFAGERIGEFVVLSPSDEWYVELVPQFSKTPEAKSQVLESMAALGKSFVDKIVKYVEERWDYETLKEDGKFRAENESSVVLYGNIDGKGILLTGDAGIEALNRAADYAGELKIILQNCTLIQIPHHGSRNNVSPSVLNRIVGPKVGKDAGTTKWAYVSASKESTTHPRRVVTNAFRRRGAKVIATQGSIKYLYNNFQLRKGWSKAEPLPFYDQVEE